MAQYSGIFTTTQQMQAQAAGNWPSPPPPPYIEDVFSTYLYTGNGSSQTITNGIDLAGEGGMTWIKNRSTDTGLSVVHDTVRGAYKRLSTNLTNAEYDYGSGSGIGITSFTSSGFNLGIGTAYNGSGNNLVSWTFRKQAKFFDVVTYTGNGAAGRTVSHSLGSTPGCIIVKRLDATGAWRVYHRSLGATYYLGLESTATAAQASTIWNDTEPTSTVFSVGVSSNTNENGGTYVAYLFAHDAGGFGENLDQNVISCGSYTISSNAANSVNLGYEPQYILVKNATTASDGGNWWIWDTMRGLVVDNGSGTGDKYLYANTSGAEGSTYGVDPTATGFNLSAGWGDGQYIYIAIRRGPMKTPTTGTSVFSPVAYTGDSSGARYFSDYGFPLDMLWYKRRNGTDESAFSSRLTGGSPQLVTSSTAAETNLSNIQLDRMLGFYTTSTFQNALNETGATVASGGFRRAPGFFDIVCYTGTGANRTLNHNLGVVPELLIAKRRSTTRAWGIMPEPGKFLEFDADPAANSSDSWLSSTSSTIDIGVSNSLNTSGQTYVMYMFATLAGVSKVGSYTGTGTTNQINCGFTGGARFVLIKRTDSTGDWYVWDSARGIVAGNDPYLLLNSTAAEVTNTDYVDTYSAGFEISSTAPAAINANGGSYIYLAIA